MCKNMPHRHTHRWLQPPSPKQPQVRNVFHVYTHILLAFWLHLSLPFRFCRAVSTPAFSRLIIPEDLNLWPLRLWLVLLRLQDKPFLSFHNAQEFQGKVLNPKKCHQGPRNSGKTLLLPVWQTPCKSWNSATNFCSCWWTDIFRADVKGYLGTWCHNHYRNEYYKTLTAQWETLEWNFNDNIDWLLLSCGISDWRASLTEAGASIITLNTVKYNTVKNHEMKNKNKAKATNTPY